MSRGRLASLAGRALCVLCALWAWTASTCTRASAAQVVLLGVRGQAATVNDPFLSGPATEPPPSGVVAGPRAGVAAPRHRAKRTRSAHSELARLRRTHAISSGLYRHYLAILAAAQASARRLRGNRAAELRGVGPTSMPWPAPER